MGKERIGLWDKQKFLVILRGAAIHMLIGHIATQIVTVFPSSTSMKLEEKFCSWGYEGK